MPGTARLGARVSEWSIALKGSIGHPADRPTLSVLIPAWNAARTISEAITSVLAMSSPALECVVVDDGSTDDTVLVVERHASTDPRLRLVRAPVNVGVSNARNLGLDAVRGSWLTFLDADDVLLPGGLEAMADGARTPGALAVIGQRVWSDGRRRWRSVSYDISDIREPGRKSIARNPGLLYYASATGKLFHESITQGLRFEGRVLGDQPWTVRALLRAGERIEVISDDVYEWRRPSTPGITTITAAKQGSARSAADAARVAVGALAAVIEEADAQLPDPASRRLVAAAYFERLVRADLGPPTTRAVARGDEAAAELFDAVLAFLEAAPAPLVAASPAVVDCLILDPLDHWVGAPAVVRSRFMTFLRRLRAAHPAVRNRMRRLSPVGLAVEALGRGASTRNAALADVLLTLRWPIGLARRLRRRLRRSAGAAGRSAAS